jgi:cobalt-zinc-cadmium resistance protein CzcA
VAENIKLPEGYFIEWDGQYKNLQQAKVRFAILIPITLIVVFFMIYMAFGSFLKTTLIFMGIPFAISGGIFALYITGLPFSISAAVGFIALLGIAVLNGMVLINGFSHSAGTLKERVVNGSVSRLRPVLMTAMTDILGFMPMAISSGIGSEVQRPLAVVVIGGIATSTILTLAVLPSIYYKINKRRNS